ncbi:hypothetical protein P7K49_015294, partial [Saguinus oedipus]
TWERSVDPQLQREPHAYRPTAGAQQKATEDLRDTFFHYTTSGPCLFLKVLLDSHPHSCNTGSLDPLLLAAAHLLWGRKHEAPVAAGDPLIAP